MHNPRTHPENPQNSVGFGRRYFGLESCLPDQFSGREDVQGTSFAEELASDIEAVRRRLGRLASSELLLVMTR